MVLVIAADRRQAKIIFNYIRSFFMDCPLLKPLVVRETQSVLELSNGSSIEVATSSYRSVRGFSCAAVLIDEGAYLPTGDSANPDVGAADRTRPDAAHSAGLHLDVPINAISTTGCAV